MGELKQKKFKLIDLVPSSWFSQKEGSSIWVTAYRIFRVPKENLISGLKIIDLSNIRAIILYGELKYFDVSQTEIIFVTDDKLNVDLSQAKIKKTPEGAYLLFFLPFDIDGEKGNETITLQKIHIATGLFAVFNGRNIVYKRVYDNIIELATEKITASGPSVEVPTWFAQPNVSESRLNIISQADKIIADKPAPEKNRILLSLRWFESALHDGGIDSFLKYWFALETLAMPDTTDIYLINESLSSAYEISHDEARDQFAVGRLFGLRGRIVHEGQIVPIHGRLSDYIEALYVDILLNHLGLPCESKAKSVMDRPDFTLEDYLHEP